MKKAKETSKDLELEKEYTLADIYTVPDNEVVIEMNLKESTDSGIIFASSYKEWDPEVEKMVTKESSLRKDPVCKVICVGPNVTRCKVGDLVLAGSRSYPEISLFQDKDQLQIREMDILGIVNPKYKEIRKIVDMQRQMKANAKRQNSIANTKV